MSSVRSNYLSLKYQRCTPSCCKNIGIRKFQFVATTQYVLDKISRLWKKLNLLMLKTKGKVFCKYFNIFSIISDNIKSTIMLIYICLLSRKTLKQFRLQFLKTKIIYLEFSRIYSDKIVRYFPACTNIYFACLRVCLYVCLYNTSNVKMAEPIWSKFFAATHAHYPGKVFPEKQCRHLMF